MPTAAAPADQVASAPAASIDDLERELKFVLPAQRAAIARRWLAAICQPDGRYPVADVWTIYYDTPQFASLDEKLNSDYLKMKVRVRWYAEPGGAGRGPAFMEVKRRVGSRREKTRVPLPVPAESIAARPLEDPLFAEFPPLLAQHGILLGPMWQPVLALRYRRRRFLEPMTGARLNLDTEIAAVRLNRRRLSARNHGPLPVAVIEVKGFGETLPGRLQTLVTLGARKQSFSKYAALLMQIRRNIF